MTDTETKKAIRMIMISASLGGLGFLSFQNGFLLAYFANLGIPSSSILFLLSLLPVSQFIFMIPCSYLSDNYGKKFIGSIGHVFCICGFLVLMSAGFISKYYLFWIVGIGIVIFGIGIAMTIGSWFALIHPIIPKNIRGRFFGNLRFTWQSIGFIFTLFVIYILGKNSNNEIYQYVIGIITLCYALRVFFYQRIPELDKIRLKRESFLKSLYKVVNIPQLLPFCSYCFLLTLFTGACPQLFNLIEKDVIQMEKVNIVFVGNLLVVGALAGFFIGGLLVDKIGTKYVFLICHFGFGSIIFIFLFRNYFPIEIKFFVGMLTIMFGLVQAASGIAMTSETLYLIPNENKSLATGLWFTLYSGGIGLSGILCAQALNLGILSEQWSLWGLIMSSYDSLLLLCGTMVLMMTVTLGLIPSFLKKTPARWIPQN